jgi:hypothetical protein
MDRTLRSILWILVLLVVLSSFSTGWFFIAKERLYDEYVTLEDLFRINMKRLNRQLSSLDKENRELRSRVETVGRELDIFEARNRHLESQYRTLLSEKDDLDKELARVKKGKFFIEKELKDMRSDRFLSGLLKEKVALEVELKRFKDELGPKDLEIERLRQESKDLDFRFSRSEEKKEALEQKLKDSTRVAEILSRDLLKEKDRTRRDRDEAGDMRVENRLLKAKMVDLEKDLAYKNQEIDKLKLAFEHKRRDVSEFRAEAYHAPGEVELPRIILEGQDYGRDSRISSPLERMEKRPGLQGRIVTVNREHNFVVIDLGSNDGIDKGTRFDVYRGDKAFGSIEVMQTRKGISACDIRDIRGGFQTRVDDIVIKR